MERLSSYNSYEQEQAQEIQSQYKRGFESCTHLLEEELETLHFSPTEEKFKSPDHKAAQGSEVLWHSESQTLIVPPPAGSGDLTPADLAKMAVPVAGFIKETQPDVVVGCDRGGRLYSLAVYSLWGERNPKKRFPTLDGKLHFARLSTSMEDDAIDRSVARIVNQSTMQAKMTGKSVNGERPRILFVDDWIVSGATREHIFASLERLGLKDDVEVNFAVMCGGKADASGGDSDKDVPWHDDPEVIGVDYAKRSAEPFPVRTKAARKVRKAIHAETKKVAVGLRSKRAAKHLGKLLTGN